MSTDRYNSPLSERYASKEMQYIFSVILSDPFKIMQKNGNSLKIIAVFLICSLCCYFCRFTILLRYPVLLYVDFNLYAKQVFAFF